MGPNGGGSLNLSRRRMSSSVCISGERPPCTHKNCWFISAASGKQSNASIHAKYTRSVYFILHSCLNVKYSVKWRHSWLPRSR
ncbi:hypothetical protein BpHYR1_053460 [Brachionus plicatilis]|uniref:Uncharacterized protein n=1 Tax=Brachionus plicatilis TaxID=10195 RepID=A0A3M7QQB5_BRAPC|nr:hypothetical protein BpHYR1_053460 [Brachionus plicatilis]